MRRILVPAILLLLAAAFSPAIVADELVHFTNGTTMVIRSHEIKDDMIEVNLGRGAVMAFPSTMVERIEVAGQDVYVADGYAPSNQAVDGGTPVRRTRAAMQQPGKASTPARHLRGEGEKPLSRQDRADAYGVGLGASRGAAAAPRGRKRAVSIGLRAPGIRKSSPHLVGADGGETPRIDAGGANDDLRGARIQPRSGGTTGVGQPAPPIPRPAPEADEGASGSEGGS